MPTGREAVVRHLVDGYQISERSACQLVGISRTLYRYLTQSNQDDVLRVRLKELAAQRSAHGYLLLHALLKAEGLVISRKRTYRIYTGEGLQVRTKRRKKLHRPRQCLDVPARVNERWSMDFVSDQLAYGRRFRVLNVVDDFSREMVGQLVSVSISGRQVARFLVQLCEARDKPHKIICDNGTEFTSKAMFFWSKEATVSLGFIQPGKPTQNAFMESLNSKFRNECLNRHWFRTIDEARAGIAAWRDYYNHVHPHSSLNYLPPAEYAHRAA